MSSKYQVVIRNSQLNELDTVAVPQGAGNKGQAVRIKAVAGQRYQLVDSAKAEGMAPDWVRVKRSGKNLLVFFEDSLEADLVIEDYYEVMPEGYNAVIGQAEVGGLYEYFPEDPDTYGLVPNLIDGSAMFTNVVLGGAEIAGFELAGLPLIAAFPWGLAAAGAAGAAALAGGGGGGGGSGDGGGTDDNAQKLKLAIDEVTDDGFLNKKESENGVQTRVAFDFDVREGDQIQVELQSQQGGVIKLLSPMVKLTADDIKRGYIDITVNNGDNTKWVNGDYKAVAKLYDANGVELTDSNLIDFKVDTVAPNIGFTLDSITGDDFVAGAEKTSSNLTLTGTATGDVKVGDKVTIIINGKSLQGQIGEGGKVVFAPVAGADLVADADKAVDFKLATQDAAGNETVVEGKRAYLVENSPNEGIKTAIRLDPIAGDNLITVEEAKAAQTIAVTGIVTGKFATGDKVTLHVNNKTFTGLVDSQGKFSIHVPVDDLKKDVDTRVDAIVKGTGGDTATANQDYQVAPDSAPSNPSQGNLTALYIDPITDDNILNAKEKAGTVSITGTVTGKFAANDWVTLTINGKEFRAQVNNAGRFEVKDVPGADLAADPDTAVEGKVTGTGGTTAHATQNYGVITDAPSYDQLGLKIRISTDALDAKGAVSAEGDGWVNKAELDKQLNTANADKFVSVVTFDKTKMLVGDKLIVTATNSGLKNVSTNGTETIVLTKEFIEAGEIVVVFNKPGQDNTQTVTVVHEDAWGNRAAGDVPSDRATEDTVAGNIGLSVERADGTGGDTTIDPIDFEQSKGVEIKVALPTDVEVRAGDVVSLQLRFDQQTNTPSESVKYTLKTQDVSQGFAIVLFPPEWFFVNGSTSLSQLPYEVRKGNYWVDAELLDQSGNSSVSNQPQFVLSQRDGIDPGSNSYNAANETKSIYLKGSDSSETIIAGSGNDWIYGGRGTNTLTGGAGSDVFIYNKNSFGAIDTITDFKFGTAADKDVLMLKDLMAGFNRQESDLNKFFKFEKAQDGLLVLKIDHDGEGFASDAKTAHVTIKFSNQPHDTFAYFGHDITLANILTQLEQDGNIVV